jgi:DNA polymerase-4
MRTVLHCDCNGFYASVECIANPELKEVPMAVCGNPENRHGIILAKNELAKRYNIQTAETIWQAKRKCPALVLVEPHHELYAEYSVKINNIYKEYTDLVEPFGIDESWLDVTGSRLLFGDGTTIANTLRKRIREELGLTISVGVSFNKVFAKLGSDYQKPDATTEFSEENWRDRIFPLPVESLLFVGGKVREKLAQLCVSTIGDLASADRQLLISHLGKMGDTLWIYANGLDDSPVTPPGDGSDVKSIGNSNTFRRDLTDWEQVRLGIRLLSDSIASRMRRADLKCCTVSVGVKDTDLKTVSRQKKLPLPTFLASEISTAAMELVQSFWPQGKPIRMLSVIGMNLIPAQEDFTQLTLFGEDEIQQKRAKLEKLEAAMDRLDVHRGADNRKL